MIKLKIKPHLTTQGYGFGVHVENAETGEVITGVQRAEITLDQEDFATVKLTVMGVQVDVSAICKDTPEEASLLKAMETGKMTDDQATEAQVPIHLGSDEVQPQMAATPPEPQMQTVDTDSEGK